MLPQKNFLELRWLLRPFGGLKTSREVFTLVLIDMVTEFWFASQPHAWRLASHGPSASAVSGAPGEPDEEATHKTQSVFCFAFSLDLIPSSTHQECVATELLVLRSPQFSLRSDREVCAGTNLCRWYVCFLEVKGWQHHPSQNIGLAIAGSAGPVLPALCLLLSIQKNPSTMVCEYQWSSCHHICQLLSWEISVW